MTDVRSAVSEFGRAARPPTPVWILAGFQLLCAIVCFTAVFAPVTDHRFVSKGFMFGASFLALGLIAWFLGPKLGRPVLFVAVLGLVGLVSGAIAIAQTFERSTLISNIYIWCAAYVGAYFTRRELAAVLGAVAVGATTGFAASGSSHFAAVAVMVVLTTTATGVVIERFVGQLRREAETDPLTGLFNRRGFFKAAELERSLLERTGLSIGVAMIDLDRFKAVNDSAGHMAGDRLLASATSAWAEELRPGDLLGRVGGDEFALFVGAATDVELALVLERLQSAYAIAWSAGAVVLPASTPLDEALRRADEQLIAKKAARRITSAT